MGIDVRPLRAADRDAAVSCLAAAFSDDPIFLWLTGQPTDPLPRLRHVYGSFVDAELRNRDHRSVVAVDGGDVVGAALWHGVDEWRVPFREVLRSAPAVARGFGRYLPRALGALRRIEQVHLREPHWYLGHVGVHPDHQGRGIGGLLVQAGTDRADAEGVAAYLENSKPRNTPFYARHGFAEGGPIPVGNGGPSVLAMRRPPR